MSEATSFLFFTWGMLASFGILWIKNKIGKEIKQADESDKFLRDNLGDKKYLQYEEMRGVR